MVEKEQKIQVKVKLFAVYQEAFGTPELYLTLLPETTVEQVLVSLIAKQPKLAKWRDVTRFGINLQFVESATVIQDGDEIVLIPPVSGG
jgi:molybdopterin synthase sulfur carrier subunit